MRWDPDERGHGSPTRARSPPASRNSPPPRLRGLGRRGARSPSPPPHPPRCADLGLELLGHETDGRRLRRPVACPEERRPREMRSSGSSARSPRRRRAFGSADRPRSRSSPACSTATRSSPHTGTWCGSSSSRRLDPAAARRTARSPRSSATTASAAHAPTPATRSSRSRCSRATPASAPTSYGQAPGILEGEQRRPWRGRAGQTLRRWLELDEEEFYATFYCASVTRCYPGRAASGSGDRVPTPREQELCAFWLDWELRLLRPELIARRRRPRDPPPSRRCAPSTASARRSSATARPSSRCRTRPASAAGRTSRRTAHGSTRALALVRARLEGIEKADS